MRNQNIGFSGNSFTVKKVFTHIFFSVFIFLLFSCVSNLVSADADSNGEERREQAPDYSAVTSGSVWLLPDDGVYIKALQLATQVEMDVSGMLVRAKVVQRFRNVSSLWAEAVYVFPLPENAAVDHFTMRVDGRVIEGRIQERAKARKSYEAARTSGQRAGLVEQQRENIFTTRLANIAPGAEIEVEIEYQQTLMFRDGWYSLRFPLVVGQRFLSRSHESDIYPEYDTGVYTQMEETESHNNPTSIRINIDAGIPVNNIDSSSHEITVLPLPENRYEVLLRDRMVPADRDFILRWQPELTTTPEASVFNQVYDGYEYSLVTIYPPDDDLYQALNVPREVVFILDVSGSMSGASIEQAKSALLMALKRLTSVDRFNIIWFNQEAHQLFEAPENADEGKIRYAIKRVSSLDADGGTEMLPALKLAMNVRSDPLYLRQLVFLTDGNVSNERDLFRFIKTNLKSSRLFTVGIGSAPNSFFMKQAARAGRGSYTFIANVSEIAEKTDVLLRKLESPALTDIALSLNADDIEFYDDPIPDMYLGEPVTILLRAKRLPARISVTGKIGRANWQQTVSLDSEYENKGVSVAWARAKIATFSELYHAAENENLKAYFKHRIVDVAYRHHLVSRYTSLVAVDVTPVNQSGVLYSDRMKTARPHGWFSRQKKQLMTAQIYLPQTATPAPLHLVLAMLLLALALILSQLWKRQ